LTLRFIKGKENPTIKDDNSNPDALKCGILYKKDSSKWKKRYFMLTEGKLQWWKSQSDRTKKPEDELQFVTGTVIELASNIDLKRAILSVW